MSRTDGAANAAESRARPPGQTDRNSRTSRTQGKRENAADSRSRDSDSMAATRPLNLPYIPPRQGYVQRWVRTRLGRSGDDVDNVARKEAEGWKPRAADTIPKGVSAPTIKKGEYEGLVGVRGNILMERPEEFHEEAAKQNRARSRRQMQAIEQQLHADHRPGQGIGKPRMTVKSQVGVRRNARRVEVQDDDED